MTETAMTFLLFFNFAVFAMQRGLTYLHIYQQEEYDSARFLGWIVSSKAFDKRLSLALAIISTLAFFVPPAISMSLAFIAFAGGIYFEKDPRKDSKKKLAMTKRAQRIYYPAMLLMALADEAESGIAKRLADISEMAVLLQQGGEKVDVPDLIANPTALTLTAVNEVHDACTRALISLHARIEASDPDGELNRQIWDYLSTTHERHALSI